MLLARMVRRLPALLLPPPEDSPGRTPVIVTRPQFAQLPFPFLLSFP